MKKLMLGAAGLALLGALAYGAVKTYVIDPKTVASTEEILALFFKARTSLPPLPSPVSYEVVAEQLAEGRLDFIDNPNWAYVHDAGTYYLAEDSKLAKKLLLPMKLLAYEDLASGKVVLAGIPVDTGKLQSLAIEDAPASTPYDGRSVSVESHLMNELWPRRVVWSAMLRPEADAWNDLVQTEEAVTLSVSPTMMAMSSPEQITDFRLIQDGTNLSVNLPVEFVGATVSLQSKTNLLDSGWSMVFQTNAPSSGILPLGPADLPEMSCETIITTNSETVYIDPINGSTNVIPAGIYTNYEYSTVAAFYRTSASSTIDSDADGLDNVLEYHHETDYQSAESDGGDGLPDGYEVHVAGTDPNAMDATQAQIDAYLVAETIDPDLDSAPDWLEGVNGTNPHDRFD